MEKRAFLRMAAGTAAVAAVLGSVSAGQWAAAAFFARPSSPPAAVSLAINTPLQNPSPVPQPQRGAPYASADSPVPSAAPEADTQPSPVPTMFPLGSFIVGVRDGFIAVYVDDGETVALKEATSIPILALPEEEQERLTQGIRVLTPAALARLLEDYGS